MAAKTSRKSTKPAKAAAPGRAGAGASKRKKAPAKLSATGASRKIDARIAELGDWRGERLAQIRKLVHEVDPEVTEEWKWMGSPTWSHDGVYAVANAHKDKVKLTFAHGAALPDPKGLLNATLGGGTWRAIDFHAGSKLDSSALKALVRAAVAHNTRSKRQRGAAKPVLLSGGNPQIAKGDGNAPVQAYIDAMPGWKRDVGRRLDELIERTVPGVRKAVRWNSPFYGVEDQGWFMTFHCFAKYIKVSYPRGSSLRPLPPVASKDPDARYFHIHEGDPLDEKQMASWIRQAAALPGWIP